MSCMNGGASGCTPTVLVSGRRLYTKIVVPTVVSIPAPRADEDKYWDV